MTEWQPADGGYTLELWGTEHDARRPFIQAVGAAIEAGLERCESRVPGTVYTTRCELPSGHGGHHALLLEWH